MTLGEWIATQMRERDMSMSEFARYIGTTGATLSRAMSKDAPQPSVDLLVKLSNGTGVSLMTLLKLAFPEIQQVEVDTGARLLAEQIMQLPPEKREIAEAFILGTLMKSREK